MSVPSPCRLQRSGSVHGFPASARSPLASLSNSSDVSPLLAALKKSTSNDDGDISSCSSAPSISSIIENDDDGCQMFEHAVDPEHPSQRQVSFLAERIDELRGYLHEKSINEEEENAKQDDGANHRMKRTMRSNVSRLARRAKLKN